MQFRRYFSGSLKDILSSYKMTRSPELVRDFIHDALYNPRDGYFQRHINIFNSPVINFGSLRDQEEYTKLLAKMYKQQTKTSKYYQLWHTPSEVFRPWFGKGIGEKVLQWAKNLGERPVVIYEVGSGNGTLCEDIISHIKEASPSIYSRLEYNLIEISQHLIDTRLLPLSSRVGVEKIKIHKNSFLDWNKLENRSCFVIAMEVFDNLPQDRVQFDADGMVQQAMVVTNDKARYNDSQSRYTEVFVPGSDPLILETVEAMDKIGHTWPSLRGTLLESIQSIWPLTAFQFERAWSKEFIPTGPFQFLRKLSKYFPNHIFLMSDFDYLPNAIDGHGGPVVQTRYEGETVACSTYLLERGLFDIFFPIDFNLMAKFYESINGRSATIQKHWDFCRQFPNIKLTETSSGYNPMIEDFENVSFLITNS